MRCRAPGTLRQHCEVAWGSWESLSPSRDLSMDCKRIPVCKVGHRSMRSAPRPNPRSSSHSSGSKLTNLHERKRKQIYLVRLHWRLTHVRGVHALCLYLTHTINPGQPCGVKRGFQAGAAMRGCPQRTQKGAHLAPKRVYESTARPCACPD